MELWCKHRLKVSNVDLDKNKVFLGDVYGEPWKNYIIMMGKRYIYQCRNNNIELNVVGYEKYLAQYMNVEYIIAKDNKRVTELLEKWSVLQCIME